MTKYCIAPIDKKRVILCDRPLPEGRKYYCSDECAKIARNLTYSKYNKKARKENRTNIEHSRSLDRVKERRDKFSTNHEHYNDTRELQEKGLSPRQVRMELEAKYTKTCRSCGRTMKVKRSDKRFCSKACYNQWYHRMMYDAKHGYWQQ